MKGLPKKRSALRDRFFPKIDFYDPPRKGFFMAPRSLPMLLSLLRTKKVSGKVDPSMVYLELLSRHMGEGLIEMGSESEHAFAAGYYSTRAVRTWRERMELLEALGLIKSRERAGRTYGYVLLLPPANAVAKLEAAKKIPVGWKDSYAARRLDNQEISDFDEDEPPPPTPKKKGKKLADDL
jgi:hypothetical protein